MINNNDDDYKSKSNEIRRLSSLPPDQFSNHLTQLHNTLDAVAPSIAPHIYATASNAVQFLNSKLPPEGDSSIQGNRQAPSQAQKTAWLDLHKTVNDPISVFDHVERGTINNHHIQALQAVYPQMYQEMTTQTMEELGNAKMRGEQLPYARRIAIAKFIGQPIDATMSVQNMQAILRSAGPNTGPEAQQAGKPKRATAATLKAAQATTDLYKTPIQARLIDNQK